MSTVNSGATEPLWPHVFNLTRNEDHRTPTQLRLLRVRQTVYIAVFLEWSSVPRSVADDLAKDLGEAQVLVKRAAASRSSTESNAPLGCWRLPLPLPLPFVVDGGIDTSWPSGDMQSVTLLGEPSLNLSVSMDEHGLRLGGLPSGCLGGSVSHVAIFKLRYGSS